jgi:hypothetical protein
MRKETRLIDTQTGEIVNNKVEYISCSFDEQKGYLFWARKSFSKSFQDVEYPPEMSFKERGQMATLAKRIWSTTNMLGYRGRGGVRPFSIEQIGMIVGLKPYQAAKFVRKMIRVGMIAQVDVRLEKGRETQYYVNPIYFFSSNRIPLNLYLIFRKQLDAVLPAWVKQKFAEASSRKNSEG